MAGEWDYFVCWWYPGGCTAEGRTLDFDIAVFNKEKFSLAGHDEVRTCTPVTIPSPSPGIGFWYFLFCVCLYSVWWRAGRTFSHCSRMPQGCQALCRDRMGLPGSVPPLHSFSPICRDLLCPPTAILLNIILGASKPIALLVNMCRRIRGLPLLDLCKYMYKRILGALYN